MKISCWWSRQINRANLMAALEGEFPEYIPFTVNEEFCTSDVAVWEELYSAGLCRVNYTSDIQQHGHGEVERTQSHEHQNGYSVERTTLRTPVGSITQLALDGWVQEYYLKEARDYRVLEYIVRQQQLALVPEAFTTVDEALGARGITLIGAGRSPMQSILVDYAGLENFSYHLSEEVPELFALAEALDAQLIERCRLIARGPGRYVSLLENLTAEIWGAARFARFHLPVYERVLPILHAGGKKVFVHYDGKLACLAPLVGKTALDGVEFFSRILASVNALSATMGIPPSSVLLPRPPIVVETSRLARSISANSAWSAPAVPFTINRGSPLLNI